MGKFTLVSNYIYYFLKAKNEHSIHSPFVFQLYTEAIKPKKRFYIFSKIEALRRELLSSDQQISVTDYGAGSHVTKSNIRTVSGIAQYSEKSPALAQLLFKLIEYLKPSVILDLGTSLGITTIYEASVSRKNQIYTFEGCPETSRIARENFKKMNLKNIQLIEGNIDDTLPAQLKKLPKIDFAFFDANHRYEPTLRYFKECLEKAHEETFFVFDDIHWSEEMEKAWEEIKNHPQVMITIDLFYVGVVFLRSKQPKQHYVLKF